MDKLNVKHQLYAKSIEIDVNKKYATIPDELLLAMMFVKIEIWRIISISCRQ